jgi:hypothetical protein
MAASAPSSPAGNVLSVMFLTACTLGGLLLLELGIWHELRPYALALWQLQHLPERHIGDDFSGPAVLHGHLETTAARHAPSGTPSVLYYAWVEDHYRSGRSTSVRVLCNLGEDEDLTFRQGRRTMPFELFHHEEPIELLKRDGYLDSLRMQPKVAIDLGPVVSQKPVPQELYQRCISLTARGALHYKEARLQPGEPVTIIACQQAGVLRSCPGTSPVAGVLAKSSTVRLRQAFAQTPLNWLRGGTVLLALALGYLLSVLYKLSGGDK